MVIRMTLLKNEFFEKFAPLLYHFFLYCLCYMMILDVEVLLLRMLV